MHTLIQILILVVVVWFCFWAIERSSVPEPMSWIIKLIIAALAIFKVLAIAGLAV